MLPGTSTVRAVTPSPRGLIRDDVHGIPGRLVSATTANSSTFSTSPTPVRHISASGSPGWVTFPSTSPLSSQRPLQQQVAAAAAILLQAEIPYRFYSSGAASPHSIPRYRATSPEPLDDRWARPAAATPPPALSTWMLPQPHRQQQQQPLAFVSLRQISRPSFEWAAQQQPPPPAESSDGQLRLPSAKTSKRQLAVSRFAFRQHRINVQHELDSIDADGPTAVVVVRNRTVPPARRRTALKAGGKSLGKRVSFATTTSVAFFEASPSSPVLLPTAASTEIERLASLDLLGSNAAAASPQQAAEAAAGVDLMMTPNPPTPPPRHRWTYNRSGPALSSGPAELLPPTLAHVPVPATKRRHHQQKGQWSGEGVPDFARPQTPPAVRDLPREKAPPPTEFPPNGRW